MAALARLSALAIAYSDTAITGRSHNVPAQATTLGKRFASAADELLVAFTRLEDLIARYPLRGIKGPVGTAQDMLDLLGGDEERLGRLETAVAQHLGFTTCSTASARSIRGRSTSTSCPRSRRCRPLRPAWPRRSG